MSAALTSLRRLYAAPEWALFTEVRNRVGPAADDMLRTADAVAVHLWGGTWRVHGFELKTSRSDWLRELKRPEKSGPLKAHCSSWYLVTPAPWKRVVLSLSELPDRWGLIECGTGEARIVVSAPERPLEAPDESFVRSLLRVATRDDERQEDDASPRVLITRPMLSRSHVGLACGHVAPRPLAKALPRSVPCEGCADGRASDRAFIEAALEDASHDDLDAYAQLIERRRGARGAAA